MGDVAKGDKVKGEIIDVGWYEGAFYSIQERGRYVPAQVNSMYLEKLSSNQQMEFSRKLEGKGNLGLAYFISKGFLYVLYTKAKRGKTWEMELLYDKYNLLGGYVKTTSVTTIPYYEKPLYGKLDFSFNELSNKNYFVIASLLKDFEGKNSEITYIRFDKKDMSNIKFYKRKISFDEGINKAWIQQVVLDDNGNIATIMGTRKDSYTGTRVVPNNEPNLYKIYNVYNDEVNSDELDLQVDQFYLQRIKMDISDKNEIYFTGLFSTKGEKKVLNNGFFLAKYNISTNEISNLNSVAYNREFFEQIGYKIKKDGTVNFRGSYEMDLVLDEKEGGFMLANHIHHFEREIVVMQFDGEGKFLNSNIVPRMTNSNATLGNVRGNREGARYFALIRDNALYLLYSDLIKNVEEEDFDKFKEMKHLEDNGIACFLAKVKGGEKVERSILFENKESGGYIVPKKCSDNGDEIILNIVNGKNKKTRYGKLKIN